MKVGWCLAAVELAWGLGSDERSAGTLTPVALTNAFGKSVSGERAGYAWNGAWLHRI